MLPVEPASFVAQADVAFSATDKTGRPNGQKNGHPETRFAAIRTGSATEWTFTGHLTSGRMGQMGIPGLYLY